MPSQKRLKWTKKFSLYIINFKRGQTAEERRSKSRTQGQSHKLNQHDPYPLLYDLWKRVPLPDWPHQPPPNTLRQSHPVTSFIFVYLFFDVIFPCHRFHDGRNIRFSSWQLLQMSNTNVQQPYDLPDIELKLFAIISHISLKATRSLTLKLLSKLYKTRPVCDNEEIIYWQS